MLVYFLIFSAFSGFSVFSVNIGPLYPPTKGAVWPKPQHEKSEDSYYVLHLPHFNVIKRDNYTSDVLGQAIERFSFSLRSLHIMATRSKKAISQTRGRGFDHENVDADENNRGYLRPLVIEMTREDEPLSKMNESYMLTVNDSMVYLHSPSIWGALRGLESFYQLFHLTDHGTIRVRKTKIYDFPQYHYRGLLLDTSRHFVSLVNIYKTLNAMAMNKMNVFHWHIVDDQSFPYYSKRFPELGRKGAYHPTMMYTTEDIRAVIHYAFNRGIRVIPEFDVPGHTRSWGAAYPDILTKCYKNDKVVGLGPMNPINNDTYTLLSELFKEVSSLFKDEYFHVGGDEVELECWQSNPELQKYMTDHNITVSQLHGIFMQHVIPMLPNKTAIVWQEVFDEIPLSKDIVVQVWKYDWVNEMVKILKVGNKLIFSASWYLDHLKTGGDWKDFYQADPREMVYNATRDRSLLENIIGGEACMWGEVVDDANVISRVWPRTSAVAERLWSPSSNTPSAAWDITTDDTPNRLEEHTCRMMRRGVHAQPPNGPGVCLTPSNFF